MLQVNNTNKQCCAQILEGQGRKKGHLSARFGFQEGTLAHVFATQEGSLVCFANQDGTLARILAPKRTL